MEHIEFGSMLANAGIQTLNILIFFGIFWYFFGKGIKESLQEKRALLDKLDNADSVYQEIINQAELEKKKLIDEALEHKQIILSEAKKLAEQRDKEMFHDSEKKAENILHEAKKKANTLVIELEKGFMKSVKYTTHLVVKKLFKKDVQLSEKYIETLVHEFSN